MPTSKKRFTCRFCHGRFIIEKCVKYTLYYRYNPINVCAHCSKTVDLDEDYKKL